VWFYAEFHMTHHVGNVTNRHSFPNGKIASLLDRNFANMSAIISLLGISMAFSKSLQQAIANIKIWHKGEQCAPHNSLLLLYVLAGYLNEHPRLFDYGRKSTNLCTVYWNFFGHSVHSTDLLAVLAITQCRALLNSKE
jgi:hypothetical protein